MDFHSLIEVGAILVAAIATLARFFDKSLSIREHEEFRGAVRAEMDRMRAELVKAIGQAQRDADRLEDRIKTLEQTRPTTGELEARLRGSNIK